MFRKSLAAIFAVGTFTLIVGTTSPSSTNAQELKAEGTKQKLPAVQSMRDRARPTSSKAPKKKGGIAGPGHVKPFPGN